MEFASRKERTTGSGHGPSACGKRWQKRKVLTKSSLQEASIQMTIIRDVHIAGQKNVLSAAAAEK